MDREYHLSLDELREVRGADVIDRDGDKIGSVEDIYVDDTTGRPEWIAIGGGFFGTKHALVPVAGAMMNDGSITVPFDQETVENTPDIDDDEISEETEAKLYAAYGMQPPMGYREQFRDRDTDFEADDDADGDDSVTLHEQRVNVGKREVPAGEARLRKWVETSKVEETVPLRRERAEVHREQINQPAPNARLGEDVEEVELSREEPVVEKQTYATERIALDKESDVEQRRISDEVARERAEIEGDTERADFERKKGDDDQPFVPGT